MLVKQIRKELELLKKCKNVSTKLENKSDATFKAWSFYLILILYAKMVKLLQQYANTTANCLQALPLPIAAKSCILNEAVFLDLSLKTSPCTKTGPVSCENQFLSLLF